MRRWWAAAIGLTVAVAIGIGQTAGGQESGPTIGPVPDVGDRPLAADDLPDLIPLVDDAGDVVGYVRSEELYVDLFHPDREFVAAGVYERDGETLIGYEIPGLGLVDPTTPAATSRPGVAPTELMNPFPT